MMILNFVWSPRAGISSLYLGLFKTLLYTNKYSASIYKYPKEISLSSCHVGFRYSQQREIVKVPVLSPPELISLSPSWDLSDEELKKSNNPEDWCPNSHERPVVIDAGPENARRVCAYSQYSDSTPFSKPVTS